MLSGDQDRLVFVQVQGIDMLIHPIGCLCLHLLSVFGKVLLHPLLLLLTVPLSILEDLLGDLRELLLPLLHVLYQLLAVLLVRHIE